MFTKHLCFRSNGKRKFSGFRVRFTGKSSCFSLSIQFCLSCFRSAADPDEADLSDLLKHFSKLKIAQGPLSIQDQKSTVRIPASSANTLSVMFLTECTLSCSIFPTESTLHLDTSSWSDQPPADVDRVRGSRCSISWKFWYGLSRILHRISWWKPLETHLSKVSLK